MKIPTTTSENRAIVGTMLGLISAVGYTAANVCLRATTHCDPYWVSCMKAVPTVVLLGIWLIFRAARGQRVLPTPRILVVLLCSALFMQFAGNVLFQWTLGILGIAVTTPMTTGSMIVTGAFLGRVFLGELFTVRNTVSIFVLFGAIVLLSFGVGVGDATGEDASFETPTAARFWMMGVAIVSAGCVGFAYSVMGVAIRYALDRGTTIATTLCTSSFVGVVSLGLMSCKRIGVDGMLGTAWNDFTLMLAAGLLTTVSFVAIARALQLVTLIYNNALQASQAAMSAVAGIWYFQEPSSPSIWMGVVLTTIGLCIMERTSIRKEPS